MSDNVKEIIKQLKEEGSVFRLLGDDEIDRVASYFEVSNFPAGSILPDPDAPFEMLAIMISGEVVVEGETEMKGTPVALSRITRGALITHPSMFAVNQLPFKGKVKKDAAFIGINRESFDAFLNEQPEIGIKFLKELIRVIITRFQKLAVRFSGFF
jgi:signal-transduction protein with cAMP-binding, CBS, and nucleotidyltransferase domain